MKYMTLEPSVEELVKKTENSPYKLAVIVGKRAKELKKLDPDEKAEVQQEVTKAIMDVENGIIVI